MDQALLERILRSPKLPTLPAIAARILDLTQDSNVSIRELAATIEIDQAIAGRVLRTINSSFYGLRRPCTNIDQAVVMLGLSTVKTLALSFSLVSTLRSKEVTGFDYIAYWQRSLYSAVAARLIATHAPLPSPDEAFLGALFQDIGMMAMYQAMGEGYLAIVEAAPQHRDLARLELAELELQHPDVGAMLAQRWKLPPELIISIKYHEQPSAAPEAYASLVRAIGLANIASDVLTARHPGPALRRFRACATRWFQLKASACDELLRHISQAAEEVSSLFILDIGERVDADAILARAADQLATLGEQADLGDGADGPICRLISDSDEFDPLTGALTRRAMLTTSLDLFDQPAPQASNASAIAIEIDGFARIVETLGQADADALLVETACVLDQQFAPLGARISRWDGAMFVVLVPDTDEAAAVAATIRARQTLHKQAPAWFPGEHCHLLSWSAGVANLGQPARSGSGHAIELVTRAVHAVEAARFAGGNSTHTAPHRIAA